MGYSIAREKILTLIKGSKQPISYAEIKESMGSSCSRVTIYRTLIHLEKNQKIRKFSDAQAEFRYLVQPIAEDQKLNLSHFQCIRCHRLQKLDAYPLPENLLKNYLIHSVHTMASGICKECHEKGL